MAFRDAHHMQDYKRGLRGIGNIGEGVACKFIEKRGFRIIERNYWKKWGELDIVAEKGNTLHFFEVKSITASIGSERSSHSPEENVHELKLKRLRRTIETYLEERGRGLECEFSFHVLCVVLNMKSRRASVRWLRDIIL